MDEKNDHAVTYAEATPIDQDNAESQMYPLPTGSALKALDTYPITASEKSFFVVIMGAIGSGKTTLITSIYQLFLREELSDDFFFAGSKTLMAFEERAYYTRINCDGVVSETARTPRGLTDNILHIRLENRHTKEFLNLLLSDFSGEDYDSVSANPIAAKESFSIVKSATSLIVLLDGCKIANLRTRYSEVQKAIHILRTFYDSKLIRTNAEILLALSKYDVIKGSDEDELETYVDSIIDEFSEQLPCLKTQFKIIKIAAMPNSEDKVPIGYGISEMLLQVTEEKYLVDIERKITDKLFSQFNLWKERCIT